MVAGVPNREVYYKINNDIDLSSGHFYMIGSASNPFYGKVDGNLSRLYNLNLDIAPADNVGIFGYVENTASFVGINLENITVKGKAKVGSLVGYAANSSNMTINEVVAKNINISGVNNVGGIIGFNGVISNVIVKGGSVAASSVGAYGIQGWYYNSKLRVKNSIVENVAITVSPGNFAGPISYNKDNSYYSNKVTVNGVEQTNGFDSSYIDDLDYYTGKVETINDGDKNNTGYYFDYVQSKKGIYLTKVK